MGNTPRNNKVLVVRAVAAAAVLAAGIGTALSWNSDSSDQSDSSVPTTVADSRTAPCDQHVPGELLTERQSVVRFSSERVCLGYVTVSPGTKVSWKNETSIGYSVVVTNRDTNAEVFRSKVGGGATVSHAFDAGVYVYAVDALPTFKGTIEVVPPR